MELHVNHYDLPSAITFNFDELKTELVAKCHEYETMVYSDDQIKQAKSDRANLNKLKKALNDERIHREKEYMAPFTEFKDKINEIISIIDKPASIIDERVKEYEQKKKDEKKRLIEEEFEKFGFPEYITFERVFDEAWLNSSCSMSRVKEDLKTIAYRDQKAVSTINDLPDYSFEAFEFYKQTLDFAQAMEKANEYVRIAKAKKAVAEEKSPCDDEIPFTAAPDTDEQGDKTEQRMWLGFKAYLSFDEAKELKAFFDYYKIKFEQIKEA